ncbi:MAG TPA: serine/threonine-protein kinase [Vicinamibacteria bacterium]|nr:serine/threonine-protein kinase [Vicinamibacteria bacterium]
MGRQRRGARPVQGDRLRAALAAGLTPERATQTCPACQSANDDAAEVCFHCRGILKAITRGTLIGARYEILLLLGRGGMGTVYRARDRVLEEEVALKVLRSDLGEAAEMEARFRAEIKLARTVSHPNVCRIHEYGEDGALRYISMELIEGENLRERLRRVGPLPPEEATRIAIDVARGLEAIHDAGVVHRDLSPFNVTLDAKERVRVMDFGIAKRVAGGTGAGSAAGYVLGNPEYMSPEQARGRRVDTRSDLYSLGVVLFEMLTGRPPFRGATPVETLMQHAEAPPPLDDPALTPTLRAVLERALAKEPEARFETAHAMAAALRDARAITAPLRRRPLRRLLVAPLLAAFGTAAALWLALPHAPRSTPAPTPGPPQPPMATVAPTTLAPSPSAPSASPPPLPTRMAASPPVAPATPPPSTEPAAPPPTEAPAPSPTAEPSASLAPAVGWLQIGVTPWADVVVDGEIVGQTPMPPIPLTPGVHDVMLNHPDFRPFPRRVTIRAGEKLRLVVDLASDGVRRPR